MTEQTKKLLSTIGAFSLLIFVIGRWFYLVNEYSVNILYWDQWDFLGGLFENRNLWDLFTWQHGPHRQGVGFFLTKIVAELSGWDTRVESFVIGFVVCLAALAAWVVKLRATGRRSAIDVIIPLVYLTPLQLGLFANTPNFSHGSMPLLLVTLFCLCWLIRNYLLRYFLCAVLNFCAVYTGFGFFLGLITPFLFLSEAVVGQFYGDRKRYLTAFLFCLISIFSFFSFFVNYTFTSAAPGFVFPHPHPMIYIQYIFITLTTFLGLRGSYIVSYIVGPLIAFSMISITIKCAHTFLRHGIRERMEIRPEVYQIIALLISFTLLFCLNLAVGRACLGLRTASASRYFTYLIPGFFGIYLYTVARKREPIKLLFLAMIFFFVTTFSLGTEEKKYFQEVKLGKQRWKSYYLQTENILKANYFSGFLIYPNPPYTHLKEKLAYLKKNRLNLYK